MENTKNIERTTNFKRGQIYIATLGTDTVGSEQSGRRPVLVIQNDIGNKYSTTMVVAMISTKIPKKNQPTHVHLKKDEIEGLSKDCIVMLEQVKTISKERIEVPIPVATLNRDEMKTVNKAILLSLGMSV